MICPACNTQLSEVSIENIKLDVCKDGCGGIWFDRFELQKMDEPHEFTNENILEVLSVESSKKHEQSGKRNCPKCQDIKMMQHFYSAKKEVKVDHCPKCAGYWLDEGELFKIRKQFKTEEERKQAALKCFSELFDDELITMRKKSDEKAKKVQKVTNMFRLILPIHYLSKIKNL